MPRATSAAAAALILATLAGCAAADGGAGGDVGGPVRIYVSLPASGPDAEDGRDAADGARLAFAEANGTAAQQDLVGVVEPGAVPIEVRYLDGAAGGDPQAAAAANARRAIQDSSSAGYIGELRSAPTRNSAPILNDAVLAQVTPGAGATDLTAPSEEVPDSPERYRPSGRATLARLATRDDRVRAVSQELNPGERAVGVLDPASLPGALADGFRRRFATRFGREPGRYAAYGYESMALLVSAVNQAAGPVSGFRERVAEELLSSVRARTVFGPYALTADGDATLDCVQIYRGAEPAAGRCSDVPSRGDGSGADG